jgi:hypothetical protein
MSSRNNRKKSLFLSALLCVAMPFFADSSLGQNTAPHLETRDSRHAFFVDGSPYLILGAQINNSSSWATTLPDVWPALRDLHVNTVEAPVYWERMEPKEGSFDFSDVDLLIKGAREHGLRLVLLWFGTWKNGQNHYVPEWMKTDTKRFPREISAYGKLLDVMSPTSPSNLEADKHAFSALMRHLRETDGIQHTVLMIQVENESGAIGTIRDHSGAADKEFAAPVPAALAKTLHVPATSWAQAYGADAEERYAAYATARYINAVASAGKAEYSLPMYCNVWITYPVHALENRDRASAGQEYPAGGPQQGNVDIWRATAPSIDLLGPDFYSDDFSLFQDVVHTYARPDNALFIPETGLSHVFGRDFYYALGAGAIGFSPFGVDYTNWTLDGHEIPSWLSRDFTTLAPMGNILAKLNFEGKLKTVEEVPGAARQEMHFGNIDAIVSFGFPQRDGEQPPGTKDQSGRALVAQLAPFEFLVTGVDASVSFRLNSKYAAEQNEQLEILTAEEGEYENGVWKMKRIWNGDQTDRGLNFKATGLSPVVRIRLHTLPLKIVSSGTTH